MWYIYFLELKNKRIYVGSTKVLEKYFKAGSGKAILKKRILTDEALMQ